MNKTKEIWISGFALFSMFFGAGNLILPPFLGFKSGSDWFWVALGFAITAVLIPLLGILAHARLQGTMYDFGKKVSPLFSSLYCLIVYTISVALPAPRTASVTYEMAVAPYFNDSSLATSAIYFVLVIFAVFIPSPEAIAAGAKSSEAFLRVIFISSILVAVVGVLTFFFLKVPQQGTTQYQVKKITSANVKTVLRLPAVWLLMVIILCAYVGYKFTDIFSLYAKEVMNYNEVDAAKTGTYLLFIRPVVGVVVGFLADRAKASIYLISGFGVAVLGALLFASDFIDPSMDLFFLFSVFLVALGVYAARVLYFAVMQEGNIPLVLTGTAVGVISVIGYTPDIFASPLMGYLLDNSPGRTGHQHVFIVLAIFSLIGLFASYIFLRLHNKKA